MGQIEHCAVIYPFLILCLNGHHSLTRVEKIGRAKLPPAILCQHGHPSLLPAGNLPIRHYPHSWKPESVFTPSGKTSQQHRELQPTFGSSNRAFSQKRRLKTHTIITAETIVMVRQVALGTDGFNARRFRGNPFTNRATVGLFPSLRAEFLKVTVGQRPSQSTQGTTVHAAHCSSPYLNATFVGQWDRTNEPTPSSTANRLTPKRVNQLESKGSHQTHLIRQIFKHYRPDLPNLIGGTRHTTGPELKGTQLDTTTIEGEASVSAIPERRPLQDTHGPMSA